MLNRQTGEVGQWDVFCLLQFDKTGWYHPAYLEEQLSSTQIRRMTEPHIQLISDFIHVGGFETYDEALAETFLLSRHTTIKENRILHHPIKWDGSRPFYLVKPIASYE